MSRANTETLLVVAGREEDADTLASVLRRAGHGVRTAADIDEALESYARDPAAVVVADAAGTPGVADASARLQALDPDAVLVVASPAADVETTVALMRQGAFHVLDKPVDPEQLKLVVAKALEHGRLSRGNRALRDQLDISERLAMIGRLASGVAHELNNPLDGVRRYVKLTQENLDDADELAEYLDRAMSGLGRMASIVQQLLTFSRNVVIENEGENLRTMLEEVVRTLAPTGSRSPTVEIENPYVDVQVPRALFQVFANIVKNALHAVAGKGARGRIRVKVEHEAGELEIRVTDNGSGIEPKDLRRVFEPFFTTKEVGQGTGLGLPISARIVERCGGAVRIESEPGRGTTVFVSVPAHAAVPAAAGHLHGAQS